MERGREVGRNGEEREREQKREAEQKKQKKQKRRKKLLASLAVDCAGARYTVVGTFFLLLQRKTLQWPGVFRPLPFLGLSSVLWRGTFPKGGFRYHSTTLTLAPDSLV